MATKIGPLNSSLREVALISGAQGCQHSVSGHSDLRPLRFPARVGDRVLDDKPAARVATALGVGVEFPAVEEAQLHVADRVLDDARGLRICGAVGFDLEAVMADEVEARR